jgi:hypothetical protein
MRNWLKDKPLSIPNKPDDIISLKISALPKNERAQYFELFDQTNLNFKNEQSSLIEKSSDQLPISQIF